MDFVPLNLPRPFEFHKVLQRAQLSMKPNGRILLDSVSKANTKNPTNAIDSNWCVVFSVHCAQAHVCVCAYTLGLVELGKGTNAAGTYSRKYSE